MDDEEINYPPEDLEIDAYEDDEEVIEPEEDCDDFDTEDEDSEGVGV